MAVAACFVHNILPRGIPGPESGPFGKWLVAVLANAVRPGRPSRNPICSLLGPSLIG